MSEEFKVGDLVMCRDRETDDWRGPYVLVGYDKGTSFPFRTGDEDFKYCRRAKLPKDLPNYGTMIITEPLKWGDQVFIRNALNEQWQGPYLLIALSNGFYRVVDCDGHRLIGRYCRKAKPEEMLDEIISD